MPELPEVETVCRGLSGTLLGRRIESVEQRRADLRIPFPENLPERLTGRGIENIKRRAKYILIELDDDNTVILHLGMSGRVVVGADTPGFEPEKHDHLILRTDDGQRIVYNDARRFGMLDIAPTANIERHRFFAHLGPEPLGNAFSPGFLQDALKDKMTTMKAALMDQRVVAGLGNIYVCEALFEAGIAPERIAATVTPDEIQALAAAVRDVLQRAIAAGGSSLRDYVQSDGELGYFQHSWAVYGKEGEACPGCNCDVEETGGIKRILQSGRSSFYCPRKQH